MKLKRIITFIKDQEKIRNQNIENQIENHNTINVNWMIKLKNNKLLQKSHNKIRKIKRIRIEDEILITKRVKL